MAETFGQYVGNIKDTVTSFWHGMSVTLSYAFQRPVTVQYPDRIDVPVSETLPARYRGFLEVDIDICTGCQACERACPIACIAIEVEKDPANPKNRYMTRFDIDEAKCMFCGLCVEPCPTGAIQHSREFEASVQNVQNLIFRWVDSASPATLFKPTKGATYYPRKPVGELVREKRRAWDAPPPPFPIEAAESKASEKKKGGGDTAAAAAVGLELAKKAIGADRKKLAVILEEAQAGTDCGDCTYPTCKDYSEAMAGGKEQRMNLCAPGGQDSAVASELIMKAFSTGKLPEVAAPAGAAPAQAAPEAKK